MMMMSHHQRSMSNMHIWILICHRMTGCACWIQMSTPCWCFAWQKVLYFSFVSVKRKYKRKTINILFTVQEKNKKFIEKYVINPSAGGRIFNARVSFLCVCVCVCNHILRFFLFSFISRLTLSVEISFNDISKMRTNRTCTMPPTKNKNPQKMTLLKNQETEEKFLNNDNNYCRTS
jgi:hypothetical protein